MKTKPYQSAWSETEEIKFINKLGTFSRLKLSRTELLQGYRAAIKHRTNWDGINKGRVLSTAAGAR